jgi:hypothetical protein
VERFLPFLNFSKLERSLIALDTAPVTDFAIQNF